MRKPYFSRQIPAPPETLIRRTIEDLRALQGKKVAAATVKVLMDRLDLAANLIERYPGQEDSE